VGALSGRVVRASRIGDTLSHYHTLGRAVPCERVTAHYPAILCRAILSELKALLRPQNTANLVQPIRQFHALCQFLFYLHTLIAVYSHRANLPPASSRVTMLLI
jgi:hypothetical protein